MKNTTIYHNPRCSKSRQALQILLENNIDTNIIEYLKTPLSVKDLEDLIKKLGKTPRDIIRKNEVIYKTLKLNDSNLTDKELLKAMAENPILIERPIVIMGNIAIIARPPEKVLELIK